MKVADFDYELPPERIATEPARPRDAARLLVHAVASASTRHVHVRDLARELEPGDLLIVNDTRVRPARLHGRRSTGGAVELLLLSPLYGAGRGAGAWRAMCKPAKKLRPGEEIEIERGALVARMLEREPDEEGRGSALFAIELFDPRDPSMRVEELLERSGRMPLPPYIPRQRESDARDDEDRERYQTIYAQTPGAVAAPTAGLHFTEELFGKLAARGVERASVTLHVGLGTFLPVTAADTEDHHMHTETYELSVSTARAVDACRARRGRVVAVGTTSVRVLEAQAAGEGRVRPGVGETALFIEPGYRFQVVDALLSNFHLPKSTLLMLVSAFAGRQRMLGLYAEAIERGYRFYSYGDATLLLP